MKKEKKEKHFSCLLFLTATKDDFDMLKTVVYIVLNLLRTVVLCEFNVTKSVVFSAFNLLKTVVYYELTIEDKKKRDLRR